MSFPIRIPVLYDFASTIAYVAHRVLGELADDIRELGAELVWQPIDMRLIAGMEPGQIIDGPRRENALRVARVLEVPVRMPPVWLDSRPAHAVAMSLEDPAREAAWRERVWSGVFEEGRDPADADELRRFGAELGIDVSRMMGRAGLARLADATAAARGAGVGGVPSLLFDGSPIGGIQDRETMRLLFQRYVERKIGASA